MSKCWKIPQFALRRIDVVCKKKVAEVYNLNGIKQLHDPLYRIHTAMEFARIFAQQKWIAENAGAGKVRQQCWKCIHV